MNAASRPLAVVSGASSGIGLELARECARHGYDVAIAADQPLAAAVSELESLGARVLAVEADLATHEGVEKLIGATDGPVEALIANAGHGLGGAFLEQTVEQIEHVIETNVTGTLYLLHRIGREMVARGRGRILIVGSIAGFIPGTFQAVYNATKAFIDSFAWALRTELKSSGVTVTCLMPGATETGFFERADMMDTRIGAERKMDAGKVARVGFRAMMAGDGDVVAGWKNKLTSAAAAVTPAAMLAEQHRRKAQPGGTEPRH